MRVLYCTGVPVPGYPGPVAVHTVLYGCGFAVYTVCGSAGPGRDGRPKNLLFLPFQCGNLFVAHNSPIPIFTHLLPKRGDIRPRLPYNVCSLATPNTRTPYSGRRGPDCDALTSAHRRARNFVPSHAAGWRLEKAT